MVKTITWKLPVVVVCFWNSLHWLCPISIPHRGGRNYCMYVLIYKLSWKIYLFGYLWGLLHSTSYRSDQTSQHESRIMDIRIFKRKNAVQRNVVRSVRQPWVYLIFLGCLLKSPIFSIQKAVKLGRFSPEVHWCPQM